MTAMSGTARPLQARVLFVLAMQCLVVLLCVGATTLIAAAVQERGIRHAMQERVLDVARSLAALPQVRTAVQTEPSAAMAELQPLADTVAAASGVDYIVITEQTGIRLTHPTPSERGRPVSTDPTEVLEGETFLGTEIGTLGPTLRAKVPIRDGETVVGTASVGILESEIAADFEAAVGAMIPWVLGSIVVGCLASAALTSLVRRRVRRLEADARELETQRRVTDALRDQTHEFRTRLHVIRGLIAERDETAALEYIARIAPVTSAAGTGAEIADPVLRAVLDGVASDLADAGGRLTIDQLSTVPALVLDDDDLVVIGNLCRNAAEAVGFAGVVEILVLADDARVHIEVGDSGPGIAGDAAEHIFRRGFSTKGSGSERGVGLDLVRRAVGERGGTITVGRSRWGGALFTVDIPPSRERAPR